MFKRRLIVLLSSAAATAGLLTSAGAAIAFLRRRVTFANVVACLALFIALGGTSMAQTGARSAVQLISGQQVKNGSLTGADIRDRSLLATDFRAGQLPSGKHGATGAKGDTGAAGVKGDPGAKGDTGAAGAKGDPGDNYSAGNALNLTGGVFDVLFGTTAGTVAAGDDPRLSDARTPAGAAGGDLMGSYPSPSLAPNSVTGSTVTDGTINAADLNTAAVTTTRLANGAVDTAQLAAGSVNSTTLAGGAVTYSKLAADAVDSQHIVTSAVGTSELAPGAVTSTKLAPLAVDTAALAANSVDTSKVRAGSLNVTDLDSAQGTTVVDPPNIVAGTCGQVTIPAPALSNNDRVMIFLSSEPSDATDLAPMTATAGMLRLRACNHSSVDDDSPAFTLSYIVLR